jgi:3-hydroxyisobutyrate dehydrogenase-like beta-hydroxyacid dehydrogenase
VGKLLVQGGRRVITTLAGRSSRTADATSKAGIEILPDLSAVAHEADVVLSVVPPRVVIPVAQSYAAVGGGAPFVDLNAKSLSDVTALSTLFERAGITFTNGCIIGQASCMDRSGRIFVSGAHSEILRAALDGVLGLCDLGPDITAATGFKMVFAGLNKSVVAALFESAIAGVRLGLFDLLFDEVARQLPGFMSEFMPLVRSYPRHIVRRADEMSALVDLLEARNLQSHVAEAAMCTFRSLSERGALSTTVGDFDALEVLRAIGQSMIESSRGDRQ